MNHSQKFRDSAVGAGALAAGGGVAYAGLRAGKAADAVKDTAVETRQAVEAVNKLRRGVGGKFARFRKVFRLAQNRSGVRELAAIDLGKSYNDGVLGACAAGRSCTSSSDKYYPSVWMDNLEEKEDDAIPNSGTATVKYRVTRRSVETSDGKTNRSLHIDLLTFDPGTALRKKAFCGILPRLRELADSRSRNSAGQYAAETAGGISPFATSAAYDPAVIAARDQQRQRSVAGALGFGAAGAAGVAVAALPSMRASALNRLRKAGGAVRKFVGK